ncbi:Uncharacterized protein BM_BM17901 [Brugia malayi]|uniref:Uncharacterized protein n=1 Tax=Brugia malayi TaxID=6279 RepID=A0A4E9ERB4_BRUMA|nr:Uncharacterized protein BM_BM17901 [Brugia malayi]VIO86101.1 Uncharacterized protein BM_BM17901 [Brugia malayi]
MNWKNFLLISGHSEGSERRYGSMSNSASKWVRDHIDNHMKMEIIKMEEPQKALCF